MVFPLQNNLQAKPFSSFVTWIIKMWAVASVRILLHWSHMKTFFFSFSSGVCPAAAIFSRSAVLCTLNILFPDAAMYSHGEHFRRETESAGCSFSRFPSCKNPIQVRSETGALCFAYLVFTWRWGWRPSDLKEEKIFSEGTKSRLLEANLRPALPQSLSNRLLNCFLWNVPTAGMERWIFKWQL